MKQFELVDYAIGGQGEDRRFTSHVTDVDGVIHIDLMFADTTDVIATAEIDLNEGVAFTQVGEHQDPIDIDHILQLVSVEDLGHSCSYTVLYKFFKYERLAK